MQLMKKTLFHWDHIESMENFELSQLKDEKIPSLDPQYQLSSHQRNTPTRISIIDKYFVMYHLTQP